jgi:hypothetical protein
MKTILDKGDYEALVLRALRHYLIDQDPGIEVDGKVRVDVVRLNATGPRHMVEILFREDARPGGVFGWRFPATEADDSGASWETAPRGEKQADVWATAFVLPNFIEELEAVGYGLPKEYDPDGITWVGDYQP